MDFGLSQDQEMLCDAISRTLADTCPLDHVRECAEGSVPFSDNVRSALGEIGIWGMMVPEQHDGLGMTMLDAAVVAEQLGYAVAPVAFIGAHVLAPLALAQGGSEELKAHWLPRIAKGEALADDGGATVRRLRDAGRVLLAADSLGAGQAMIEKAVDYAGQREQFGRVIGSFQAVKHMCAEMAARHEPCRSLVWYAAHAFDATPDEASLVACHAKSHTGEVHRFVARTSTEVHGGMGFTDLLGLHFWFKRIGFDRQVLGSPEAVRAEAAALQGWTQVA